MIDGLSQISALGTQIADYIWIPLLVWTVLALVVLTLLRFNPHMHVQYHYHTRLALIFALPVGLLISGIVEMASGWLATGDEATAALKFIVIQAPLEITASGSEESSLILTSSFWYAAGLMLFLTGSFVLFCKHLYQYLQLNTLRKKLNLMPIESVQMVSKNNLRLARECGKTVYLAYIENELIPVTFGVRKPVILLPNELMDDSESMNLVLRHELVHVKCRDYLTHLMSAGIRILFWFHPIVHLLYHQLIEFRELRCDNHVLSDDSISRKKYASLLFELLPMPNLNKNISVNMAQESSNLKKRINMMKTDAIRSIPFKASFTLFCSVILATSLIMSCTDMQPHTIYDDEDLNLMTDLDQTGERGYHQVLIYLNEEGQIDRHSESVDQLSELQPEHIQTIEVLRGEAAEERHGPRARHGVIRIEINRDPVSTERAFNILGLEVPDPLPPPAAPSDPEAEEDYYVVVEEMPELIGGLQSIQQSIEYPEEARRAGIEGRVYIQFVVNEEGRVENPRVIRGIGGGADEAAIEAVKQAEFKPGIQRGQPVRVQYSLPVIFRLPDSSN